MDEKLAAWGRAVKQRHKTQLPTLWYFSDSSRGGNFLSALSRLPRGLCGVVFRHDDAPDRTVLGQRLAAICRARGIALVVAGDARLAALMHAGVHLRGGAWPALVRVPGLRTASAHNAAQCLVARRAGANIIFLSPVFSTASHPGGRALGVYRWRRLAGAETEIYALGGITGQNIGRLGRRCRGAGAIGAFETS